MTNAAQILRHVTAFLDDALSQSDLRHRLLSSARRRTPSSDQTTLKTLTLAAETIETAISSANPSSRSASLRLSEKLLLPFPQTPLSTLLLALIHALRRRPNLAALRLLDLFIMDPSSARSEIAPSLFEDLFLVHLLPAVKWFGDRRSQILASISFSPDRSSDSSERSRSAAVGCRGMLAKMSGEQAAELKTLERDYEEVLDENCKVFAGFLKELLENSEENTSIAPPSLVLMGNWDGGGVGASDQSKNKDLEVEEKKGIEENGLRNGRYNVMGYFFLLLSSSLLIAVSFVPSMH